MNPHSLRATSAVRLMNFHSSDHLAAQTFHTFLLRPRSFLSLPLSCQFSPQRQEHQTLSKMLSLLLITLLASLRVCLAADSGSNANTNLPLPPPLIYSSVDLAQLCADSSNYCIYVDQVRPGTVRASPYIATDNRKYPLFPALTPSTITDFSEHVRTA